MWVTSKYKRAGNPSEVPISFADTQSRFDSDAVEAGWTLTNQHSNQSRVLRHDRLPQHVIEGGRDRVPAACTRRSSLELRVLAQEGARYLTYLREAHVAGKGKAGVAQCSTRLLSQEMAHSDLWFHGVAGNGRPHHSVLSMPMFDLDVFFREH